MENRDVRDHLPARLAISSHSWFILASCRENGDYFVGVEDGGRISGQMMTNDSHAISGANEASDGDLLARFANERKEEAFAELVRRHGAMVLAVCRSVVGESSSAEDAAQAVFLTLAQKAG